MSGSSLACARSKVRASAATDNSYKHQAPATAAEWRIVLSYFSASLHRIATFEILGPLAVPCRVASELRLEDSVTSQRAGDTSRKDGMSLQTFECAARKTRSSVTSGLSPLGTRITVKCWVMTRSLKLTATEFMSLRCTDDQRRTGSLIAAIQFKRCAVLSKSLLKLSFERTVLK